MGNSLVCTYKLISPFSHPLISKKLAKKNPDFNYIRISYPECGVSLWLSLLCLVQEDLGFWSRRPPRSQDDPNFVVDLVLQEFGVRRGWHLAGEIADSGRVRHGHLGFIIRVRLSIVGGWGGNLFVRVGGGILGPGIRFPDSRAFVQIRGVVPNLEMKNNIALMISFNELTWPIILYRHHFHADVINFLWT